MATQFRLATSCILLLDTPKEKFIDGSKNVTSLLTITSGTSINIFVLTSNFQPNLSQNNSGSKNYEKNIRLGEKYIAFDVGHGKKRDIEESLLGTKHSDDCLLNF